MTLRLRVKAVPGARADAIAGVLGDRLKVRVSAAPEGGKANAAIGRLLAGRLGVPERDVRLVSGATSPAKVFEVSGLQREAALDRLGIEGGEMVLD